MNKKAAWVFTVLMFALFAIPGAASLFTAGDSSETPPSLVEITESQKKANLEFPSQFDDYFSDNFGFRKQIVAADALARRSLLGQSSNEQVILGSNDWMYYSETLDSYTGAAAMDDRSLFRMSKTIELMDEYLRDYGVTLVFFSAPNKNSVYPEYMPLTVYRNREPSNLDRLSQRMNGNSAYIDMKSLLLDSKKNSTTPLYRRYDSHWNNVGALRAFEQLEANLNSRIAGFDYVNYADDVRVTETQSIGDISEMLLPDMGWTDTQYDLGLPQNYSFESPMNSEMDAEIKTVCSGRYYSAICYRDSFFNALIPVVSNSFQRVRYTRALPYDLTQAVNGGYHIAVIELVERNLNLLIENAPVSEAPVRCKPEKFRQIKNAEQLCSFVDNGDTVKVSGIVGDWRSVGDEDCIYIEMRGENDSCFFEAYPIAEGDSKENDGFSATISKLHLQNDQYKAYIHIGSPAETRCAPLIYEYSEQEEQPEQEE